MHVLIHADSSEQAEALVRALRGARIEHDITAGNVFEAAEAAAVPEGCFSVGQLVNCGVPPATAQSIVRAVRANARPQVGPQPEHETLARVIGNGTSHAGALVEAVAVHGDPVELFRRFTGHHVTAERQSYYNARAMLNAIAGPVRR